MISLGSLNLLRLCFGIFYSRLLVLFFFFSSTARREERIEKGEKQRFLGINAPFFKLLREFVPLHVTTEVKCRRSFGALTMSSCTSGSSILMRKAADMATKMNFVLSRLGIRLGAPIGYLAFGAASPPSQQIFDECF